MAAITMAACANKSADETAKAEECSRMTECNISVGGLHFTKSLNGAEKQVSDSAGIVTFRAKPHADYFCDPNEGKMSQNDAAVLLTEIDNKKLSLILPRSNLDSLRKGHTMRLYYLCMPMKPFGKNYVSSRTKEETTGW